MASAGPAFNEYRKEWRKRRNADPEYRAKQNELARDHQRKARAADPARHRAADRARNATQARKDYTANRTLFRQYGITLADKRAALIAQGHKCAVCGLAFASESEACVDHDHATGKVRDLLCSSCNVALGHAGDSPERLRQLAAYLERH